MSKTRRSPAVSCGSSTSTTTPSRSCAGRAAGRGRTAAAAQPLRRRSALAAAQLSLALDVSYHSNEFAEAQDAQRALAATAALCGAANRAAADAEECLAGIDPELPGLLTTSEL